ncbi:MAG: MurR/RpiR family transcriptional regulator [Hyphomicrobiales bacterium]|nr:MAG: MurR/RpiR family transcriptional regulator [Hyphomicrobiales bacterium]
MVRAASRPEKTTDDDDVIAEMRASYDRLTQSQKRIAEFVVDEPEQVAFSTVDQVANKLGINPSTIVRFTYRLGLAGFPDLQSRIQQRLKSRLERAENINDGHGSLGHLEGTSFVASLQQDMKNLHRTVEQLSKEDLEAAVSMLVKARRVYVCAGLSSYAVAHFFALILDRLRSDTVLVSGDGAMSSSHLSEIGKNDVLVAFTFPPYAATTRQMASWAKESGAKVLAVTDTPISAVGQIADTVLLAACSGTGLQNSLVGAMAVSNTVLNGVTAAQGNSAMERYRRLNEVLSSWNSFILK